MALGAERARIVRLLLTESVVLSGLGAAAGLLFARWGLSGISALAPKDSQEFRDVQLNFAVLAFTVLLSLAAVLISGLAPALNAVRQNVSAALSQGGRSVGTGTKWVRNGIVIAQVAFALVLLAGAGLMIRSLNAMMHVDLGYRVDHLLTTRVSVADPAVAASPDRLRAFDDAILDAVQRLPGVLSASISSGLPMADFSEGNYNIEGQPKTREMHMASQSRVSEGFFSTLGMPIVRGRNFTRPEAEAPQPPVVIVSEGFARKSWPGTSALGKVVLLPNGDKPDLRLVVVGITNDTHQMGPDHEPVPALFVPSHLHNTFDLALRTAGDPTGMASAVEKAIWSVDPQRPVEGMLSMQKRLHDWADERRFYMAIMALFAGLALTLAVLGLYGVLAYVVSLQTREMGVRMAVGATRADLMTLVVGQSAKLTLVGVAIGSTGALLVTRFMQSMVFGISTADPIAFVAAAAALVATALAVSYAPARRAAKVDPIQALRNE
jgi:predicted permease